MRLGLEARCDQAAFELVAKASHDAKEHVLGDASGIAGEQFVAVTLVLDDQGFKLFGLGAEEAFLNAFEFDLAEVFDLDAGFLMPTDQRALGDAQFLGNTVEAPAFGAEFDELVFGFFSVHGASKGLNE